MFVWTLNFPSTYVHTHTTKKYKDICIKGNNTLSENMETDTDAPTQEQWTA